MNEHQIEAAIDFHRHETGTPAWERRWLQWVKGVEKGLGHDLDGDQGADGYSLDLAHDFYSEGLRISEAVEEFAALKAAARKEGW